jgi:hypothetical protein
MFFYRLEELHLSANNLHNLSNNVFQVSIKGKVSQTHTSFVLNLCVQHEKLRFLYLSCNYITDFNSLSTNLVAHCPRYLYISNYHLHIM